MPENHGNAIDAVGRPSAQFFIADLLQRTIN
jgi:hypothetical protein